MFKKLSLAIVALIFIMSALCIPAFAEPSDSESGESVSSAEYSSSDFESGESSDEASSENEDSSAEESSSQYYIPDDSDYFTESLNSLGGTVTSGSLALESNYTSKPGGKDIFNLKLKLQQALWIPLALICVCILVLVIFNRVYIVKYKKIDLEAKYKAQQKAAQQRAARQRNGQATAKKPSAPDENNID